MPTVIVIAAGDGSRWGNHLGVPKHFAEIEPGEPILHRTVRQFTDLAHKVWVVGPDDPRYDLPGAELYVPTLNPFNHDADKFVSSRALWVTDRRTIVAWGDVWFSEAAVATIAAVIQRQWTLFARPNASALTGKPCGEIWAHSFWPEHQAEHVAALDRILCLRRRGVIRRNGGWEHYKAMCGLADSDIANMLGYGTGERMVRIDDYTEDVDDPEDWRRLKEARRRAA